MSAETQSIALIITSSPSNGLLLATPCALVAHDGLYEYQFRLMKSGQSGSSRQKQSGKIQLTNGKKRCFGSIRINYLETDKIQAELKILLDGDLVARELKTIDQSRY